MLMLLAAIIAAAQGGHPQPPPPPPGAKSAKCVGRPVPQLEDITAKTGITFRHTADPAKKYIVESMSGGVILLDYDRDGWLDIYFTNAPTVDMAVKGQKSRGALYHNNHDGTFTDVTDKAGLDALPASPWAERSAITTTTAGRICTSPASAEMFSITTMETAPSRMSPKAGVADGRWSTGAAFGDYDGDGFVDLMVTNYVDFHLNDLPGFGTSPNCKYRGIDVQCGPRGLKGAGDALFHNNGDGTFTDVSKTAGVNDPNGYYGMGVIWADFNNYRATGHLRRQRFHSEISLQKSRQRKIHRNWPRVRHRRQRRRLGTSLHGHRRWRLSHTGRPSLYVTNFSDEYDSLFRNDGNWSFTDVSYPSGVALPSLPWVKWGTAFVDVDNDGWLDLIAVSGHVYPQVDTLAVGRAAIASPNSCN